MFALFPLIFLRVTFFCEESQSAPNLSEATTEVLEGVKHPLEHSWSFWMFTNDKKKWEDNLIELTAFNTVEDYWSWVPTIVISLFIGNIIILKYYLPTYIHINGTYFVAQRSYFSEIHNNETWTCTVLHYLLYNRPNTSFGALHHIHQ